MKDPRGNLRGNPVKRHAMFALIFSLPVATVYLGHYLASQPGWHATGFIQGDMAYYMANARQYLDGGSSLIFYANPYDWHAESPRIYFQPFILLLAGLLRMTPDMPGLPFAMSGIIFTLSAFMILQRLVDRMFSVESENTRGILSLFAAWGGGLFALAGLAVSILRHRPLNLFVFDPGDGWWFLNLGRNFFYPTEAFYHLITLLFYLAVLEKRKKATLALALLIAASSPFTGVQYALIAAAWVWYEGVFIESPEFTLKVRLAMLLPLLLFLGYYIIFLGQFEAHRELLSQWQLDWSPRLYSILAGWGLVASLVLYRCRTAIRFSACMQDPYNRFLLLAAVISFLLAKHEAFITPHQPIHFTRGHIWLPLCLLALPVMSELMRAAAARRIAATTTLTILIPLIFADNLVFIARCVNTPQETGIYISDDQKALFMFIDQIRPGNVLLSDDPGVNYLSATFSSIRPYYGHWANTPEANRKRANVTAFFMNGTIPEELRAEPFLVVTLCSAGPLKAGRDFEHLGEIGIYSVFLHHS